MTDTPLTPTQIAAAELLASKHGYLVRLLVGADDFFNVLFGGNLDQTISSRSQQLADRGNAFGRFMVAWLDAIQSSHGQKAEAGDLERATAQMELEQRALNTGISACCGTCWSANQVWTPMEQCGEANGPEGLFAILRCPACGNEVKVCG